MRRVLVLLFGLLVSFSLAAQSNKLIKELEGRRGALQKQIAESESLLQTTRKDVGSQLQGLAALTGQIEERKRYIVTMNNDVTLIEAELASLQRQLGNLQKELGQVKEGYASSVRYLYRNRTIQDKLMFIFSAKTLEQTYRRLRYVREYASYQQRLGEDIKRKQQQIEDKRQELAQAKASKERLLQERETEKKRLEQQEQEQKALVNSLRKKQRSLQSEIARQRKEADRLNARIDCLIAEEIEKARKRAAEEERREASKQETADKKLPEVKPLEAYTLSRADRKLSGNFADNRGRLPMPVNAPYIITSHYGQYTVPGLRGVKLDNKGIDIQTRPGAQACAIFNGKVAAVFRLNGLLNILVRHGSYISVYCNLSSALVKADDTVTTGQPLGVIFSDKSDGGRTVLHFQLRRETEKLNPEHWLKRF